jgi:triosephosphate isomerase
MNLAREKKIIMGNWKMNGLMPRSLETLEAIFTALQCESLHHSCNIFLCPPTTLLYPFHRLIEDAPATIKLGAQNCHHDPSGAHTGDISAEMLANIGAKAILIGHSERRKNHHEDNAIIHKKIQAAHKARTVAVVCIGETESDYHNQKTHSVIFDQITGALQKGSCHSENTIVAYEPVWAIGSGLTPTAEQIREVCSTIRNMLQKHLGCEQQDIPAVLYGGSVLESNVVDLTYTAMTDGVLVGGASLTAQSFLNIIRACSDEYKLRAHDKADTDEAQKTSISTP